MDNKNLIIAVILSALIMVSFQWYYSTQIAPQDTAQQGAPNDAGRTAQGPGQSQAPGGVPSAPGAADQPVPVPGQAPMVVTPEQGRDQAGALAQVPRVRIESPRVSGSISLIGARFDDLVLDDYRETVEPGSPKIRLLNPIGGAGLPYYAQFGWVAGAADVAPPSDARWTADSDVLRQGEPVTLTWQSPGGARFNLVVSLDRNYMFTITQRVENTGSNPITVYPFGRISRTGTPQTTGFYILHEGLLGVFNGVLEEIDYEDVQDDADKLIQKPTTGGWLGITDKYWLTALIPDQASPVDARFSDTVRNTVDTYQADFRNGQVDLAQGASAETTSRLFAGAKEANLLMAYRDELGITRFDLAIDWGWFEFLTKPIFIALDYFNKYLGNMGLSILLLTVLIKLAFFPLANKSYKAMAKMKELQPEMMKLRERYENDKARLNQEIMGLYKREKANPASGCLPILPQIPVFFALYKVLFVAIEMRHAPFIGWVQDLSAPDNLTFVNLFGLISWTPPDYLIIGVWPIVMGVTMYLQQKLNPPPPDPMQAKIFMFLPVIFTIMLARFPVGLVIYWAWNNFLSILQQYLIMRRAGVPIGGGKTKTPTKS